MGLDSVELIMNIEETFDLTIPDQEAEKFQTVGDIYRYVLERIQVDDSPGCLSSKAFYRLRRVLIESFEAPRSSIRPTTRLDVLIPRKDRDSAWQRLEARLKLNLPGLQHPAEMQVSLMRIHMAMFMLLVVSTFVMVAGKVGGGVFAGMFAGLIGFEFFLLSQIERLTRPYALEFAPSCRTIRGIVDFLVEKDLGRTIPVQSGWSEVKVWEAIRALIVGHWDIDPEAVTEDARIIDFG